MVEEVVAGVIPREEDEEGGMVVVEEEAKDVVEGMEVGVRGEDEAMVVAGEEDGVAEMKTEEVTPTLVSRNLFFQLVFFLLEDLFIFCWQREFQILYGMNV